MLQRHPPHRGGEQVERPPGRPGQVEVDQRDRQPAAEDDVLRGHVAVRDQLRDADHVDEVGRQLDGGVPAEPVQFRRRVPAGGGVVQPADQPPDPGDHLVRAGPLLRRRPRHVALDVVQDVPAAVVDAEEARRAVEADRLQVPQVRLDEGRLRLPRPAYGRPDPDDALGDVAFRQRHLEIIAAHGAPPVRARPARSAGLRPTAGYVRGAKRRSRPGSGGGASGRGGFRGVVPPASMKMTLARAVRGQGSSSSVVPGVRGPPPVDMTDGPTGDSRWGQDRPWALLGLNQ